MTQEEIIEPNPIVISEDLPLPMDLITKVLAIYAARGMGKTYLTLKLAEQLGKLNLHFAMIDPMGVCWGLRSSADGQSEGLAVIVMGGKHGDVPLEPTSGKIIAEFLVENKQSAVLDLSLFRKAEQHRFVTDFAEELYHRNTDALHLIIDEADLFAPQQPMPGEQRMLGSIEDLVRRGRVRGIGLTLVTQRPSVLNKNVSTQADGLIALRLVAEHDSKAIEGWLGSNGTKEERTQVMASLATLPVGTAWFYSPGWLQVLRKIRIAPRETFDSSATPKAGSRAIEPQRFAPVDLEALRKRIEATIEKSKADDPKVLRQRIVDLEKRLKTTTATVVSNQPPAPQVVAPVIKTIVERVEVEVPIRVEVPVFEAGQLELIEEMISAATQTAENLLKAASDLSGTVNQAIARQEVASDTLQQISSRKARVQNRSSATPSPLVVAESENITNSTDQIAQKEVQETPPTELNSGQRKILEVLASRWPLKFTKTQLGQISAFAASGGTFRNYLNALRKANFVDIDGNGLISASTAGRRFLGLDDDSARNPKSLEEMLEMWNPALNEGQRKLLKVLVDVYPNALTKEQLGETAGYASSGGTFRNYINVLRNNGLVVVSAQDQTVKADDALFPTISDK